MRENPTDVYRMLSDVGGKTSFMKKAVVTTLGETFFRDPNGNASIWSNMKSRDAQEQEEYVLRRCHERFNSTLEPNEMLELGNSEYLINNGKMNY